MTPTFVDLFSGAGGMSIGFVEAGWSSLLAVDNWDDAVETHRRNEADSNVVCADLRAESAESLLRAAGERPDWVIGGPPCQGFSTVGKRDRDDPRNELVWEFVRLVDGLEPQGIVIENVLGLRDMDFVGEIRRVLADVGYFVTPVVLRAADYGVPQLRRRIFFIGDRQGRAFRAPESTHSRSEWVTVWDAIGDLPELKPGEEVTEYTKPPKTEYQRRMRRGSEKVQAHIASNHADYLVEAISFIPDGGNRRDIPDQLQPESGYHNSYSRLHSKSPAVAVTQNMGKPSGTRCIHPFQDRGLTAREGARLQGFPDRYHFVGGIGSQRRQVANAVPPILAELLASALMDDSNFGDPDSVDLEFEARADQLSLEVVAN